MNIFIHKNSFFKVTSRTLFVILISLSTSCCTKAQETDVMYEPSTEIGRTFIKNCEQVARIFRDTTFIVAVGVDETDLHLQTMEGYVQQINILRIDTKIPGIKIKVAMPNNSNDISSGWQRQTLSEMATILSKPRARVVGMINGDFWNITAPINPRGPVHCGGKIVSSAWDYSEQVYQQALSFVAINYQGKMVIDTREKYESVKTELRECTGAGLILLSNGHFPGTTWNARDPRTAIGYTSDGIVYFLTADGRKVFGAAGLTYTEMSAMFKALGCEAAANLDGGGSAQFLIRHPLAQVFQIRNSPADGKERPVVNAWAVTVDEP